MEMDKANYDDILSGIGAGFQSYDPNNMFRGAGAAISANTASRRAREARATEEDFKIAEEQRTIENAKTVRGQQADEALDFMRRKSKLEKDLRGGVKTVFPGTKGPEAQQWMKQFHAVFGKHMTSIPGAAPINPETDFEMAMLNEGKRRGEHYSMREDARPRKERGMMKTNDGRMVKAVEDTDQETPLFGDKGRDYAY